MKLYRVSFHEEQGDKFTLHMDIFATDADDAAERVEQVYPGCEVIHAVLYGVEDESGGL